jgi:hypothetical protein
MDHHGGLAITGRTGGRKNAQQRTFHTAAHVGHALASKIYSREHVGYAMAHGGWIGTLLAVG